MPDSAHERYLTTEVLTATPQKTHLLLIEAALRGAARGNNGPPRKTRRRSSRCCTPRPS